MNVGEVQRILSLKAERKPEHRFGDLYHYLYDGDWLRLAHDHVAQNRGSVTAGCDGTVMKDFDENLEDNLKKLQEELRADTFEPYPVRRVYIPKGGGRYRPLGIPSVKDRIVQEAIRIVLEPIYEADFSQYSFGFRPNRCPRDALQCIIWCTQERKKYFWVIEGDIKSYFDTINHQKLIKLLRKRVKDERFNRLIWKYLRAGVMEKKLFRDTLMGTPQGGVISPLLANIYLHEFDKYMEHYTGLSTKEKTKRRKMGQANFSYIRYADDFVVLSNGTREQTEAMKEELYELLKTELKLTLSREKTKITHLNDGFKFLGFWIQRRMGYAGMRTKIIIPKEACQNCLDKIRAATDATTCQDSVRTKILALNRIIEGWCRYYQYTNSANSHFRKLEYEVFWMMAHWLGRKFQLRMPSVMRRYRKGNTFVYEDLKLTQASKFKTKRYKGRFIKPNPYTTQTVEIRREELPTEIYWTGYEPRLGTADLRPMILRRDGYTCQRCGKTGLTLSTSEMDHKRPARRFKLIANANHPDNLWTLCIPCHKEKTKVARQGESRMRL